jgi:hypothetical protein
VCRSLCPRPRSWRSAEQCANWGSDRCHGLPAEADTEATIGSSEICSLRLIDPSGCLSRQHARLTRDGMRLDGVRRPKVLLEQGSELGLGGVTLIAESPG